MEQSSIGHWLKQKCEEERLTLREAGAKCGLSHATIADIVRSKEHPRPETIRKLAQGFGGDELERHLFILAGYREREGEPVSEALVEVIDKVRHFSDAQLKMIVRFADFLAEIEEAYPQNPSGIGAEQP